MSRTRMVRLALTAILSAGAMAVAADTPVTTRPLADVDSLRRALSEQVKRNRQLEAEVKELQARIKDLQTKRVVETRVTTEPQRVPDNWRPFEFNGMTVYVVPLGTDQPPLPALRTTTHK